jgi:hypothetical protein
LVDRHALVPLSVHWPADPLSLGGLDVPDRIRSGWAVETTASRPATLGWYTPSVQHRGIHRVPRQGRYPSSRERPGPELCKAILTELLQLSGQASEPLTLSGAWTLEEHLAIGVPGCPCVVALQGEPSLLHHSVERPALLDRRDLGPEILCILPSSS